MWGTRPHHSWMTRMPGPLADFGTARWPLVVRPSQGNSTFIAGPPGSRRILGRRCVVGDEQVARRAVVASADVVAVGLPEGAPLQVVGVESVDLGRLLD